jgi:hypothetical protein
MGSAELLQSRHENLALAAMRKGRPGREPSPGRVRLESARRFKSVDKIDGPQQREAERLTAEALGEAAERWD